MSKRIALKEVLLHGSVFVGGKNFKSRIVADASTTIEHYIDGSRNEIHVIYNGFCSYFSFDANVMSATPYAAADADIDFGNKPEAVKPKVALGPVPQGKIKAQVSAPNGIKI